MLEGAAPWLEATVESHADSASRIPQWHHRGHHLDETSPVCAEAGDRSAIVQRRAYVTARDAFRGQSSGRSPSTSSGKAARSQMPSSSSGGAGRVPQETERRPSDFPDFQNLLRRTT